ncbi:flagellar basal body P-ring protein FlgI [Rickettsiales endosymbiont of Stachyamoeba lipophora]|uniref:flagellar basal body P-ring protein FlgI n=1 Tax=Rickettsiales endosymbiont of Stachyamoeba lipophora TaxID=2486578 RepID=UPI000F64DA1F|nr:flagellar basal body P-ring protein FlgI [Rickettsiales endosymbiont of Stachyamoeba lipophora]AZL16188.1 flagellar basal body P-ring protein FlgI [Rickettsiales endosymbiont of Stachyamoeba lipophora]
MKGLLRYLVTCILYILLTTNVGNAISYQNSVRIKDIVSFEGIRENLLIGYGLVVGLNGTGDDLKNSIFTQKGLTDFLEKLGINTRGGNLKTRNVAAVVVTAKLPAFARQGSRIDITVSTLGDAKSLQDGTLLATTLLGADGQVYAVAQGQVMVSGFQAKGNNGTQISKNVTTNASITNGAIIEREIPFDLARMDHINLSLHNPDISTALQIADIINISKHEELAKATDPGTVKLFIPVGEKRDIVRFLASIEQLAIYPDQPAKIVIDEASGTIVMGENVRISPIAIAQGNLTVIIKEQADVIQPNILGAGETATQKASSIEVDEEKGNQMIVMPQGTTLGELVDGLNALGIGPRDLISILQTIKSSGALQSDIVLR